MQELLCEKGGTALLPAASSGVPAPIVIYGTVRKEGDSVLGQGKSGRVEKAEEGTQGCKDPRGILRCLAG